MVVKVSDEKIMEVAESFTYKDEKGKEIKIPAFPKRVYENEVYEYNYIIVRYGRLSQQNACNYYTRRIEIVVVYENEQIIEDFEIINAFKNIGLNFVDMNPDDVQAGNTNKWIDMNTYVFERSEKKV